MFFSRVGTYFLLFLAGMIMAGAGWWLYFSSADPRPPEILKLRAAIWLILVLAGALAAIGLIVLLRLNWVRKHLQPKPTKYTDAWKIAGERAQPIKDEPEAEPPANTPWRGQN